MRKDIGQTIVTILRKPLAKIVERVVVYGLIALCGLIGATGQQADNEVEQLAAGIVAVCLLMLQTIVDQWHHRRDTQEVPDYVQELLDRQRDRIHKLRNDK